MESLQTQEVSVGEIAEQMALESKGIDPTDIRYERILIKKAPSYLIDVEGAAQTYVF